MTVRLSLPICAALSLGVALSSLARPAQAQSSPHAGEMKRHAASLLRTGLKLYQRGKFAAAARKLREAYDSDPHQTILFAWAQALRQAGRCGKAIELFRLFKDSTEDPSQHKAARDAIALCKESADEVEVDESKPRVSEANNAGNRSREPSAQRKHMAERRSKHTAEQRSKHTAKRSKHTAKRRPKRARKRHHSAPELAPRPDRADDTSSSAAWYRDPFGLSLTGLGLVGLGTSGAFYLSARSAEDAALAADNYQAYDRFAERGQTRRTYSAIALASGGVLLTAGLLRFMSLDEPDEKPQSGVALWSNASGSGLVWSGVF
jgi:tetratricopeptide (TPR) repeat protein